MTSFLFSSKLDAIQTISLVKRIDISHVSLIILNDFYSISEHVTSIIASLLRNSHGTQRQRLLSKFTENDHEKVERLMELHFKYLDKVRQCDDSIEKEKVVSIHSV